MKQLYHIHYVILEPDGFERGEDEYVRTGDRERVERHAEAYLLREVFELDGDRLADVAELDQSAAGYWRNPATDDGSARYDLAPIDAVPVIDLDAADQAAASTLIPALKNGKIGTLQLTPQEISWQSRLKLS